ncbi:chemokine XC receptor 1 [Cololabis saira]|uniref:chemokine XC receptor 1 n=1 Tax=Cololabis saira TaxID=129043 RepID=UPI002AD24DAB|nr:chemokine XC receptor 1 [Cololabis saira]
MENISNLTDGGDYFDDGLVFLCEYFDISTVEAAFFVLIFIISVIGNSLLICVLVLYEKLKNVTNLFVFNLACSDLIFTATLPFWAVYYLQHWIFGDFMCKFMAAAYFVGLYSSVILLTAMTVDRFVTVVLHNWPINNLKRQRCATGACVGAWIISVAASLSDAMKMQVYEEDMYYYCEPPGIVELGDYFLLPLLFFLPFAIVIFSYCAIIRTVLRASNRKRHRAVAMVLFIVAAFFICWGPYNTLLFIKLFHESEVCETEERLVMVFKICRIFAFSHCCMNPLLYMLSQKLRKHLLQLLYCKTVWRSNERSTVQTNTVIQNVVFTAHNSAVMLDDK